MPLSGLHMSPKDLRGDVPNVQIREREERRPPRQCNWQKGEVYY